MSERVNPKMQRWRWLVWSEDGPPGAAKRAILQVLFDFLVSSKGGKVFPSVETIASKAGITKKHVLRHLDELEAAGWLRRKLHQRSGQGWRLNEYELYFPDGFDSQKDPWLNQVESNRKQARAEYREEAGWQPDPPF